MRFGAMAAALAITTGLGGGVRIEAAGPDLAAVRAALANESIPIADRTAQALEAAAELDRIAQDASAIADRRARWAEASALLEDFARANPEAESTPMIRFQAAVYLWAEGRSHADRVELAPGDAADRAAAIERFDRAIGLLRAAGETSLARKSKDAFAQNVRFRLSQALADRGGLEPEGSPARGGAEGEALSLLDEPITEPRLRGFARLLRAELSNRRGLFTQAQMDVVEAEKAVPPVSPSALIRAKVDALAGSNQYAEARKVIAEAKIDDATRAWLEIRVLIARRRALPSRKDRAEIDAEAFGVATGLLGSDRPEATRALMDLARAIDSPGDDRPAEWWDLVAEGQLRLGNPGRAGQLASRGADRAGALGQSDRAASLRFKAGACLFEAGKFSEADAPLAAVGADDKVPSELRARAGMLQALAKGRAVAAKQPGATRAAFLKALEEQVRRFPDEVATGEARWLLGKARLASGRRDEAIALWSGVPRNHARWLESRIAAADRLRDAVNDQRVGRDPRASDQKIAEARQFLALAEKEATPGDESVEIALRVALLELIPDIGRTSEALDACERILKGAASPAQHEKASLIRVVALARAGRLVEAEREALAEARQADPAALLVPLRLLDRAASEADADLHRRRLGRVYQVLTTRLAGALDEISPRLRDEAQLRMARAYLFAGESGSARRVLTDWGGPAQEFDDALLRDLADTYFRLEAYPLAAEAERLRASKLPPGSPSWFEARYNLALAYYRHSRFKEARQIIDATAILHPELGGGELKAKFERLRQRLAQEE